MDNNIRSTYDIRSSDTAELTVDYAWNIGKALADWLPTNGRLLVAVWPSEEPLGQALIEGLRLQGRAVIHAGPLSKEQAVARISADHLSGAVIVSHDDLEQTPTIEIYQHEGHIVTSETGLTELTMLAQSGNFVPAAIKGELSELA